MYKPQTKTEDCRMSEWSGFFRNRIEFDRQRPVLEPRDKPCGDCAVICGFYEEIVVALEQEPTDIRRTIAEKWFCHSSPNKACRGSWDRQQEMNSKKLER